ncbi:MAG: ABC transporter ATP-binding protein [Candidatus Dormibacteraceae bacterium]
MTGGPLLHLDGVSKRFGSVVVAESLSLLIGAGDVVGMVGPNGAGKSSLFSLIAGDLTPNAGDIRFQDRSVTRLDAAARCRLGIARTYQVPRSFEHMTVFENVLVAAHRGAGLRGSSAHELAKRVLVEADLWDQANHSASRLGLVQRKRLELARALGVEPRLLLLDEVAAGLTEPEVAGLVEIVSRVRARGVAVIWVEHVVRALVGFVDRLICLAGGRFIADGDPHTVIASTAVKEVFLGTSYGEAAAT